MGVLMFGASWIIDTVPEQFDWMTLTIFLIGGMLLIAALLSWAFARIGDLAQRFESRIAEADATTHKGKRKRGPHRATR
jgi:hypothetical protein